MILHLFTGQSSAAGGKESFAIAISPCTDVVLTFKKFHPLVSYLAEKTGFSFKLVIPRDYAEFNRGIKNGDIDFALQDPNLYAMLASLYDQSTIMRSLNPEGGVLQAGVVIARQDSSVRTLADLKGKNVMFGPKLSAARWEAAKLLFAENGIDIDRDLRTYSNGGCCEDIAFSVYLHAVDAGVVCDHFLAEHSKKQRELGVEAEQLLVVAKTRPVPTRVFAASRLLPEPVVTAVSRALLGLDMTDPGQAEILSRAEVGGFEKAKDEDYEGIRKLIGLE